MAALPKIIAFSVALTLSLWIQEHCSRMLAIYTIKELMPAAAAALRKVFSCIRGEQEQITAPVS